MRFRPPKPVRMTLNLAPMVDVMMCLIIFFLLASRIVSAEYRALRLPYAHSAAEIERHELGQRVVINVRPSLTSPRDAEYCVQTFDGQRISEKVLAADQVATFLQTRAAQVADPSSLRCLIRADKSIAWGHVEVVVKGCGLAKIAKVVFSAHAGDDPEAGGGA